MLCSQAQSLPFADRFCKPQMLQGLIKTNYCFVCNAWLFVLPVFLKMRNGEQSLRILVPEVQLRKYRHDAFPVLFVQG